MELTPAQLHQRFIENRPNYVGGQKVMPNDVIEHVTGRRGIVHGIRHGRRLFIRWIDADGNRVGRRSTVDLGKVQLVSRHKLWEEVAS